MVGTLRTRLDCAAVEARLRAAIGGPDLMSVARHRGQVYGEVGDGRLSLNKVIEWQGFRMRGYPAFGPGLDGTCEALPDGGTAIRFATRRETVVRRWLALSRAALALLTLYIVVTVARSGWGPSTADPWLMMLVLAWAIGMLLWYSRLDLVGHAREVDAFLLDFVKTTCEAEEVPA